MATTDPQLPVRIDQALTGRSDTARKPAERRGCIAHYRTHFARRPYSDNLVTRRVVLSMAGEKLATRNPTSKLMNSPMDAGCGSDAGVRHATPSSAGTGSIGMKPRVGSLWFIPPTAGAPSTVGFSEAATPAGDISPRFGTHLTVP
jgi:hypothetical protein